MLLRDEDATSVQTGCAVKCVCSEWSNELRILWRNERMLSYGSFNVWQEKCVQRICA